MNTDFLRAYKQNLINDEPIEIFQGLKIYPVQMRNYVYFTSCLPIIQMDKNATNDAKFISMSNLDFLIYTLESDKQAKVEGSAMMLYMIISLITRDENCEVYYGKDENKKSFLQINNVKMYKKDFEKFKTLILSQNVPYYDDEYIDPELKADLEKAEQIRSKGQKPKDIEYRMAAVVIGSSMTYEQVLDMTIRRFSIISETIESKLAYQMHKQAQLTGFVEYKHEIPHYLSESNNSLENRVVDYAQFKDKISNA